MPEPSLPETLAQIYDAHFDFVWRNARRLGIDEASAEDVAQDVFLVVQRRIAHYDGRASMRAWIFGILLRVASDHRRSYRRKGARNVPFVATVHDADAAPAPTPVDAVERAEQTRQVEQVLEELDEEKRAILILSEFEDWTLRQIAELYASNTNTIYSRLLAAKRAFAQAYLRSQAGKEELP